MDINATLALELSDQEVLNLDVKIFTSKRSVSVCGLNFKNSSRDLKERDIVSTTTQVVDSNDLSISLVEAESKSCSSGLVDDSLNFQVGNLASILGCLSLLIVKVSWNCHHCFLDRLAEISLSCLLHLGEHEGTNLRGRVLLATSLNPCVSVWSTDNFVGQMDNILFGLLILKSTTNQTFASEKRIFWILNGLSIILS